MSRNSGTSFAVKPSLRMLRTPWCRARQRSIKLDEFGLQQVSLVQLVEVGVGQGLAGGLANVQCEQVSRHKMKIAKVDDVAGGLRRADGHLDGGNAGQAA